MDGLFFALQPDAAAATRAVELAARLRADRGLRTPATGAERLHVTLHHLGPSDALPDLVTNALRAAQTLDSPAFDVSFDLITSFKAGDGKKHPLVLVGRQAMQALQVFRFTLGVALRMHGVNADKRSFTPHLTLLRDARAVPEQSVAPIAWTAREFVLIRSLIGQGQHIVLGRWPLHA